MTDVLLEVWWWLRACANPVGRALRQAGRRLHVRPVGVAVLKIFPLPFLTHEVCVRRPRGRPKDASTLLVNMWVALLNVASAGPRGDHVCSFSASAAQSRCLDSLKSRAQTYFRQVGGQPVGGIAQLRKLLRLGANNYDSGAAVLPLGVRAGVPAQAATVDTASVLAEFFPKLAENTLNPKMVLKDPLGFEDGVPPHDEAACEVLS